MSDDGIKNLMKVDFKIAFASKIHNSLMPNQTSITLQAQLQ